MIRQLAHICLHTQNLEKTRDFYTKALGLKVKFDFEKNGEPFGYYLELGGNTFIEVFKGDPADEGSIKHVALEVLDMDFMIEKIKSNGYETGEKSLGADNTWQVWLSDPNGVRIELHQYTAKSSQLTGNKCTVNW